MSDPIETEQEYQTALGRIEELWCADPDTPEGQESSVLVDRVIAYEEKHFPIPPPKIKGLIAFRAEQMGIDMQTLSRDMGSEGQLAMQMMAGLVPLTPEIAHRLAALLELDLSGLTELE